MRLLIMTGLTLPEVLPDQLQAIQAAAGAEAEIVVVANREDAMEAMPTVEVLLGWLDPELLAAAPQLRWVHATASGIDAFLFPAFMASDALLTSEKGLVGGHLADHAFALLLALTRQLAAAVRLDSASWQHRRTLRAAESELEGQTMGIIGFGGTGRAVGKRAAAFGLELRAVDREAVEGTVEVPVVHSLSALPRLLARSDVITICTPLTSETERMFNDDFFGQMKPGALLINVTRGEIIDGDALVRALQSGRLGGAGLDVAPEEPLPPDHPLWGFENVVMTPHTAGASQLRAGRNIDRFAGNLRRFRHGQPLVGQIDKVLGY